MSKKTTSQVCVFGRYFKLSDLRVLPRLFVDLSYISTDILTYLPTITQRQLLKANFPIGIIRSARLDSYTSMPTVSDAVMIG